jgi:MFS family permease
MNEEPQDPGHRAPDDTSEELSLERITPRGGALPMHLFLNRPFLWLLLGQMVSAVAFWALLAAEFSDAAFRFHATPTQQFVLWGAFSAPYVLLTPFQSILVDRWSPKWMNFIGYVMLLLAIPSALYGHSMAALYLSMFFMGIADAAIHPAGSALTGLFVEEKDLVRANGMLSAGLQISGIIGMIACGILIGSSHETRGVYLMTLASALLSLPFFALIQDKRHGREMPAMTLRDLADGAVTAVRHPELRLLMILSTAMFIAIAVFVSLEPLFIRNTIHLKQQAVSFIWAAHSVGALIGALDLTRTKEGHGRELGFVGLAFVMAGVGALLYVVGATYLAALVGSAMMGVGFTRFFAPSLALIQRASTPEKRGRVTSVFFVLEESTGLFAALAFAALALPTKAVQPILIAGSGFMVLVGLGALYAIRRRAAKDEQAA